MDPANLPQMPCLASTLLHLSATMIWGVRSWNGSENWFPTKIQPVKDRYAACYIPAMAFPWFLKLATGSPVRPMQVTCHELESTDPFGDWNLK